MEKEICEYCEGSGEVAVYETDGEGLWMEGVGVEKCICLVEKGI